MGGRAAAPPNLARHQTDLDGPAEAEFVGRQDPLGDGRSEGKKHHLDLMRIQVPLPCVTMYQ